MTGREIQAAIYDALRASFDPEMVVSEWSVRRGAADTFRDVATYAPRLDVAVGPFNSTFENRARDAKEIRYYEHAVVERLRRVVLEQNHGLFYDNRNPRCLIGIEIEHSTSSKHILGGITNASMLGLLGVVVGSDQYIDKVRRIHAYARKLKEVGKARADMFGNVACFDLAEFLALIRPVPRVARRRGISRYRGDPRY